MLKYDRKYSKPAVPQCKLAKLNTWVIMFAQKLPQIASGLLGDGEGGGTVRDCKLMKIVEF